MKRLLLIASLVLLPTNLWAQASFTFKDASGSTQTAKSVNCAATVCPLSVPHDTSGNPFGIVGNPFFVTTTGTNNVTNAGTFAVQATQAGTWTIQPGNTANTTAWLVTGTGGVFPATQSGTWNITNISGTISLPTGASTAAKQPALGTAGTASADVITIQGIASMTPILTTLSGTNNVTNAGTFAVQAAQSGTWTVQPGNTANTTPWLVTAASATAPVSTMNSASANAGINAALSGVFDDTTPTSITENSFGFLRMSANRNLYNTIRDAAGNERGANVNVSNQLSVSCDAGCSGGTFNNNADAVATSSTNGQSASWLYGFNGTTWDRLRADTTNGLWVNVKTAVGLAQGSTTSGQTGSLIMGAVTTSAPTYTTAQTSPLSLDTAGNLRVNVVAGGGSGGTSSTFGAAFPGTGTAIGVSDGTNMIALRAGTAGTAASTVITVQGVASMTKLLVTPDSVALPANQSVNVSQINAVTPLMGNGVTGTGSQRVTIASDNTAFAVNSTLSAETTKVIGTVRTIGNAGAIFDAATGAAVPANALYIGMAQAGNLTGLTGTSGNLNVQCANCSGSGVSTADEAAFTAGSSLFAGGGGFFQTTATNNALTTGQQGMFQVTANRAIFSNLRNAAGTEVGTSTTPLQVSIANTGANATAMLVTGTAGTFPVTGTVTANAGTGTLATSNAALALAIGSTTSGSTGPIVQCAVTTAAPTYTTAQNDPLSCDTAGNLRVSTGTVTVTATNLSTNIAQINGVTPLMGNGTTGTGSQRVTIASDNTAFSVNATLSAETTKVIGTARIIGNAGAAFDGATGAAPPANALYVGANTSGATGGLVQGLIQCDTSVIYDASTSGSTELKALTSGRTIYVCGYELMAAGTVNVKLIYGTGTACATGSTNMTPAWQLTTQVGLVSRGAFAQGLKTASANALCINTSGAVAVQALVYYAVL